MKTEMQTSIEADRVLLGDDFRAIRERLQNSVNWMMEGRNTGLCPGVADFQALIRLIDASAQPVAWAVFAPNGNCRMWSQSNDYIKAFAEQEGLPLTPLYAAAVAD
jgi:hypothetical protein